MTASGNRSPLSRRQFLWLMAAASGSAALTGCAIDPVTGGRAFILMSKEEEIAVDRQSSPQQFSADFGKSQDTALNTYINGVGVALGKLSHRPDMPYNLQAVNANYINAYAFPGGSIACTRGILLELGSEDELGALLGHELGHVNARHAAKQQSKGMLTQLAIAGLSVAAGTQGDVAADLAGNLGGLASGALLAHYSRDNEREADALGLEYLYRGHYNPAGMRDLMAMLNRQSGSKPGAIELMFATHPMSSERVANINDALAEGSYASATGKARQVERYMDHTARLRQLKAAIKQQQDGESQLGKKDYAGATATFRQALTRAPDDYTGLVLTGRSLMLQEQMKEAEPYLTKATQVYPQEAQAHQLLGVAALQNGKADTAFSAFASYDRILPGNPSSQFFMGYAQDQMQHPEQAAGYYGNYLKQVQQGDMAVHAYRRLQQWGYVK